MTEAGWERKNDIFPLVSRKGFVMKRLLLLKIERK